MSAFLVLYAALFVVLVLVLYYVSTRGTAKPASQPSVVPASPAHAAAKASEEAQATPVQPAADARRFKEEWKAAHTDATEVEAFAHTKALDDSNRDPRVGSKLRAAKQRGSTVQGTLATVQKMVLTPAAQEQAQAPPIWESYLHGKAQDRLREKKGTPFIRCTDGSYTSEYQRLLKPHRMKA